MIYQREKEDQQRPAAHKDFASLDMRNPGQTSIMELQQMDKAGKLQNPQAQVAEAMDPAIQRQRQMAGLLQDYSERFTDVEIDKFKEAFTFFDRSGDGTIRTDDVTLAMRAMGALITGKQVRVMLAKYDVN